MVPLYGFSIIIWFHYIVSQSKNGFQKDGFLKNLVNYMFPNQTSTFSRYSVTDSSKCASTTDSSKCASTTDSSKCASTTDSSKCASTTDSSCFRAKCKVKRGERWYHLFGLTQNGYLTNHKVVCRCDFRRPV